MGKKRIEIRFSIEKEPLEFLQKWAEDNGFSNGVNKAVKHIVYRFIQAEKKAAQLVIEVNQWKTEMLRLHRRIHRLEKLLTEEQLKSVAEDE